MTAKIRDLRRRLLVLLISAAVTLVIATLAVAGYGVYRKEAARARKDLRQVAEHYADEVCRKFQIHLDIINSLAQIMGNYRKIEPEMRRRIFDLELYAIIAARPQIIDIFTVWEPGELDNFNPRFSNTLQSDESGNYITMYSRENGDIHHRAYANWRYALTRVQQGITFSRPAPRTVMGESLKVLTMFAPIFDSVSHRIIGLVGVTIDTGFLQTLIMDLHPYTVGKAALFAYDGMSVANVNVSQVGEEILADLPTQIGMVISSDRRNFVIIAPFSPDNSARLWTLRLTVPKSAVLAATFKLLYQMLMIAVAVILLASFVIYRQVHHTFTALETSERQRIAAEHVGERVKNEFFTKISHELRTPLNAILGLTQIMRTDNLDNVQANYLKDITRMTGWLLILINDVLDFEKIETGKITINSASYNLYTLIERIVMLMKPRAEQKGLNFVSERAPDLPRVVQGDELRVRQIIGKVLENAVKYTERGTVKLTVQTVSLPDDPAPYWAVQIMDTGRGISADDLSKIFNAGTQLEYHKNRGVSGIGMGLVLAKKLLEMQNGKITVQSAVASGSTFTLYFPLLRGDDQQLVESSISEWWVVSTGAVRVLVVDDIEVNLTVAAGFLASHNITADLAKSGESALQKMESKNYDLILMDHMMPGLDGCETTRRLRDAGKTLPVIAFSANATTAARQLFRDAGMNDFMPKPLDDETLNSILLRYLPSEKIDLLDTRVDGQAASADNADLRMDLDFVDDLDVEQGVFNMAGDWRKYRAALQNFAALAETLPSEIRAALAADNFAAADAPLQLLRESLAAIGAPQLTRQAEASAKIWAAETARRNAEIPEFLAQIEKLAAALRATSLFENSTTASRATPDG